MAWGAWPYESKDVFTVTRVSAESNEEYGSVRQWTCRVFMEEAEDVEVEIGHTRVFTAPELDVADSDAISAEMESVMTALAESDTGE